MYTVSTRQTNDRYFKILVHVLLMAGVVIMLWPFVWMVSTAIKPSQEVLLIPPRIIPSYWDWSHFRQVFSEIPMIRYFINSIIVAGIATGSILITSSLTGFIFAKYEFPAKNLLFYAILATLMVPFQFYMIPLYNLMIKLGWVNTYQGIIFPQIISSFGTFFLKQNMESIPDDLLDAARIDGCTELGIFRNVAFPLSKASISALGIFSFVTAWAEFMWPLIVTMDKEMYVLELGLAMFQHQFFVDYGKLMAGATISTLPVVIAFIFLRRNIIEGITLGGVKY
jgi:multiple sugar transport system permease protein